MSIDWLEIKKGEPVNVQVAIVADGNRFPQLGREIGLISVLLVYAQWVQVPLEALREDGQPGKVRYYIKGKDDPVSIDGNNLVIALRNAVQRARIEADEVKTKR